jgi:hypothetical protein
MGADMKSTKSMLTPSGPYGCALTASISDCALTVETTLAVKMASTSYPLPGANDERPD